MRRTIATAFGVAALLISSLATSVAAAPADAGAVFMLSNQTAGNEVLVWTRHADGSLTPAGSAPTGGLGTGGGLGSQGAIALSDDEAWLVAVNAASHTISLFRVNGTELTLTDVEPSGGVRPTSVTVHGNLVYAMNAGGDGNIAGFRRRGADLEPIAGSIRPFSQTGANAGQIEFSPDGKFLVVAERASHRMTSYPVDNAGVAGAPTVLASPGRTPFGFAFTVGRTLIVSEAASGSASSYSLTPNGGFQVRAAAVPDFQLAPCWFVATDDGRLAYTTNAASGSISGYRVEPNGAIELVTPSGITASFGPGTSPTDEAIADGFLYADLSAAHELAILRIEADGSLTILDRLPGLPIGAVGLAAS